MAQGMAGLPGWRAKGCGACFAWVEHPFGMPAPRLARRLVAGAGVLLLPATMFMAEAARHVRIAFANVGVAAIAALTGRLRGFRP